MNTPAEPAIENYPNSFAIYFAATRPPFVLATLVPILVGFAYVYYQGITLHWFSVSLAIVAGLFLGSAVNVLNDYYDALNGTDAANIERIYPFTGGSRFIQNGVLSIEQTRNFGLGLLLAVTLIGLYLVLQAGFTLLLLGLVGIVIGWAYSAPPFQLNSRGLGELSVIVGYSLLPLGSWLTQTGTLSLNVLLIAIPLGLLTCNLLYINEYPDRKADISVNKMNLVARLPHATSRWGYWILSVLAWLLIVIYVITGLLPQLALISILPMFLSSYAAVALFKYSEQPKKLETAIKLTITAMLLHGVLLTVSLLFAH